MKSVRILIVENELISAQAISLILEKQGYNISIESTGEAALQAIEKWPPDLILLDIDLGKGINGIEVSRWVEKSYHIPIIFLTRFKNEDIFQQAIRTVPYDYISKPFLDHELVRSVMIAINYIQNSPPANEPRDFIYLSKSPREEVRVNFSEILYLKANTSYTHFHFLDSATGKPTEIVRASSSNNVIARMNNPTLVKVHRSYYVNINRIDRYTSNNVYIGNIVIPMSKTGKTLLESKLPLLRKK